MQIISGQQFLFQSNGNAQAGIREFDVPFTVTGATTVIEGMDVEFTNRNDHHLGRLQVFLSTEVVEANPNRVIVRANFGLRDWSGGSSGDTLNGDDAIKGMTDPRRSEREQEGCAEFRPARSYPE